ncbi:helix-turn-helix domain-containing protein [Chitinophaga oryziterrae]|uniref:Helix-turn-helix domain-containing protein n=1 Tax=Chitinophaga oryziterrae TaxID=1031224 RepID=A0A6N8JHA5_9BACT|nr:helix-turn-helix domain-containing protein [Chitinophaga oryziterrae]MVT43532.1 helix-turn-helix domain-containing protein [Chitinophaga oryziterrae]
MRKKTTSIPVNHFGNEYGSGISIEKMSFNDLPDFEGEEQSERHDCHTFHLLEKGTITIEIDFQKYEMKSPSVIYMHPNQVHRIITFENVSVSSLGINNVNLNPEYLTLLEYITPARPLSLSEETFSIISESISLCLKFSERKNDKLYHSSLKDSCNTLVAFVVSQYLDHSKSVDKFSRFEIVTKAFNEILEPNYTTVKRPTEYAKKLNISTPYLNECVKNTTGYSVSYHIQQRIILEAKRLLYHSDKSVKEIAIELGYDDYRYFSRLFTKVTGMTALSFRNKNLD